MKYEKEILHFLNGGDVEYREKANWKYFRRFGGFATLYDLKRYIEKDEMELRIKPEPVYEYQWVSQDSGGCMTLFRNGVYLTESEASGYPTTKLINTKREMKQ